MREKCYSGSIRSKFRMPVSLCAICRRAVACARKLRCTEAFVIELWTRGLRLKLCPKLNRGKGRYIPNATTEGFQSGAVPHFFLHKPRNVLSEGVGWCCMEMRFQSKPYIFPNAPTHTTQTPVGDHWRCIRRWKLAFDFNTHVCLRRQAHIVPRYRVQKTLKPPRTLQEATFFGMKIIPRLDSLRGRFLSSNFLHRVE